MVLQDYSNIQILISTLKLRDEKAYSYLYDKYSSALYGIIYKIVKDTDEANDILQEVFINIWKNIEQYNTEKGGTLFTWMLNIARNKAIDKYRQKNRIAIHQRNILQDSMANQHIKSAMLKTDGIDISKMVNKIKPELKQLIDLHYFKGYTHQEITALTEIPLGTVKTKMRMAMEELKKVYGVL